MSAAEIELKIHKKQGVVYFPKRLRKQFGLTPVILPNDIAAILYSPSADPVDIIKSLQVLIKHLELRVEKEAKPT
jgi:hypothetical protein